jgi:hypothetical protein
MEALRSAAQHFAAPRSGAAPDLTAASGTTALVHIHDLCGQHAPGHDCLRDGADLGVGRHCRLGGLVPPCGRPGRAGQECRGGKRTGLGSPPRARWPRLPARLPSPAWESRAGASAGPAHPTAGAPTS